MCRTWSWCAVTLILAAQSSLAGDDTLVVGCKWSDSVGFYDPETGKQLALVEIGRRPHEMALSADGRLAYVTLYGVDFYYEMAEGGRAVAILDLAARKKLGEIDLGKYRRPHGIELGHQTRRLFVTCDQPAALLVVDPAARKVDTAIELADSKSLPHMVAVLPDEKIAYVANCGTGTLSVIDLEAKKEVGQISIGGVPMGMALTHDGRTIFATNRTANGVAVIDTAERRVKRLIEVAGQPVRAHLTPDERWLLVTLIETGQLAVVDPKSLEVTARQPVGQRVEGLMVDPAGRFGYAAAQADNKVVKFSLGDWRPVLEIPTAQRPDPLLIFRPF